jgi:outer membrane protein insertion porin family
LYSLFIGSGTPGFPVRAIPYKFVAKYCILILSGLFLSVASAASEEAAGAALFGRIIRNVEISADLPLNRSHYNPYLQIKPGDLLTRTGIKKAIQFLYETGRFAEVEVEATAEGDGVNVRFNLRHNYYFNNFAVSGDLDLKGRSLWEWISLPTGQRFTAEKMEEARRAVLNYLKGRGFYLAEVTARPDLEERARQVNTLFQVRTGKLATVRSLEVSGVPPQETKMVLEEFGFREGSRYDRSRLNSRLENLRKNFIKRGYLAAAAQVSESFEPENNTVVLKLQVANFGRVRIMVEGFGIDKAQLPRLLPALSGEGINPEILEEGLRNLRDYLENRGYPEADVTINETVDSSGVRVFHYTIVPSHKFTVARISFKGNKALTDQEMLSSVKIQPTTFLQSTAYSAARLDEDVESLKALYQARGYLVAKVIPLVEPLDNGKKLAITYLCEEGPVSRTSSLMLKGNQALTTKELMAKVKLAPGAPYSPALAERDRQTLLASYNDKGYLQAQVTVRTGSPDQASAYPVEFQISEGSQTMVDRVFVLGNERTRDSVINKRIHVNSNEPLSLGKLLQTQQSLYGLGIFDQVRVTPQNGESTAPYQDVVIRLQESRRFTVRYGVGYQEREKLRGTIELSDLNIFGTARRADLRLRGSSIEQQALLSFKQPEFRALPVESYFTLSALQRRDVSFDSKRFSLSYQFSHPFSSHIWGLLRYDFTNVRLSNLQVSESEVGREDTPRNLSTFSVAFVNDSRDNYLDPTKGFFSSTDFGITTKLLGSNDYFSFFSQNSYYRPLRKSLLMAGSLRLGLAHPFGGDVTIPISERYFAGGSSNLRGFETDYAGPLDPATNKPLGGNALVTASLEIRIPFFSFVHLAGFYDTGNVFRTIGDVRLPDFSHSLGLGVRIKTPFGPLRADYGYNLNLPPDLRNSGLSRGHLFITVGPPF